jgi:hypothetical protein|tara:strand:- start:380 stop:637 length:258 start_codon:yes stop_codon:yes gene_type:complete
MRIVKTWRGEPFIMNEDIKDMENWNQKFGNTFAMVLGMCFVFAFIMFFYEGCSWEGYDRNDKIVSPEEKENADPGFNASDWILFK